MSDDALRELERAARRRPDDPEAWERWRRALERTFDVAAEEARLLARIRVLDDRHEALVELLEWRSRREGRAVELTRERRTRAALLASRLACLAGHARVELDRLRRRAGLPEARTQVAVTRSAERASRPRPGTDFTPTPDRVRHLGATVSYRGRAHLLRCPCGGRVQSEVVPGGLGTAADLFCHDGRPGRLRLGRVDVRGVPGREVLPRLRRLIQERAWDPVWRRHGPPFDVELQEEVFGDAPRPCPVEAELEVDVAVPQNDGVAAHRRRDLLDGAGAACPACGGPGLDGRRVLCGPCGARREVVEVARGAPAEDRCLTCRGPLEEDRALTCLTCEDRAAREGLDPADT